MNNKKIYIVCALSICLSIICGGLSGLLIANNQLKIYSSEHIGETTSAETSKSDNPANGATLSTVADVTELCTKVIVNIEVESIKTEYTGGSAYSKTVLSYGTGIIMTENGYIATCYHVVKGANKITIIMDNKTEYVAQQVGYDERFDLAVLHIDANGLEAASLGDCDTLRPGEGVVVIGNPLGEFGSSVSAGVLSATRREVTIEGEPLQLLQSDAAVNPGNSGGGMFNMRGELIGMVNAKMSAAGIEGLGFAIPLNSIRTKVNAIIGNGSTEKKAFLGVGTKAAVCFFDGIKYDCVEVTSVRNNSAAEQAGVAVGDYLLSANGKEIKNNDDLVLIIKYSKPGDKIEFDVCRNNEKMTIQAVLKDA